MAAIEKGRQQIMQPARAVPADCRESAFGPAAQARRTYVGRLLSILTPSPAVATVVFGAWLAETVLLGLGRDSILRYKLDIAVTVVLFLACIWLLVGQIANGMLGWLAVRLSAVARWMRFGAWGLLAAVIVVAAITYLISWRLYFKVARFANVESIHFALTNAYMVQEYVRSAERRELWLVAGATAGLVIAFPFVVRRCLRSHWTTVPASERSIRLVWYPLVIIVLGAFLSCIIRRASFEQKNLLFAFANRMHPGVTLVWSAVESVIVEPIPRALSPDELVPLSFPWKPAERAGGEPLPSVIVLFVDGLRHDVVGTKVAGRQITPNINALARAGLVFTHAYSHSNHSDYADPTLPSSLYPLRTRGHHYFTASDPWPRTMLYEALKDGGYTTAMFSSQNEEWGGMAQFLSSAKLDFFFHPETADGPTSYSQLDEGFATAIERGALRAGKFDDGYTTDRAIDWIKERIADGQPYFAYVVYQNSHFPYHLSTNAKRPFQPADYDPDRVSLVFYPEDQAPKVRNAYYNALHDTDRSIGRLVAALRAEGTLNNTILVVLGDHGQAFREAGCIGHGCKPVEPTVHIGLIMHAPERIESGTCDYPVEIVDIAPTVLGLLGWPVHPNFQGIDILSATRPPQDQRLVFLHMHTPFAQYDGVILAGRWKLLWDRETGLQTLVDLHVDPNETTNVIEHYAEITDRLRRAIRRFRARQLAYYHYDSYYLKYYPPRPPRWNEITDSDRTAPRSRPIGYPP